ncbi:MAG TPA: maleylpyruvate isomerase N-terminal domain-containing protein [Candidatus Limnocylindria bacterium]
MNDAAKRAALDVLDREWRELDALFRGLTPADLERPMYTEDGPGWRIRDLIPHLATWQDRAARAARKVVAEGITMKPDDRVRTFLGLTDTVDDMNDVTFRTWRERSVADLLGEFRLKHDELMRALGALAPQQLMNGETVDDVFTAFRVPGLVHLRKHQGELATALAKEGAAP